MVEKIVPNPGAMATLVMVQQGCFPWFSGAVCEAG